MPPCFIIDVKKNDLRIDILFRLLDTWKNHDGKKQFVSRLIWYTLEMKGFLNNKK